MKRISFWMLAWMLPASALLAGCSTNPTTGEKQLILISREQEIAMGEEAAPQFEQEFDGAVDNPELQAYVSSVGQRVAAYSKRDMPYEFTLVKSNVPNAFALPGGKIFVTAGLMSYMENERELAAVLGHEVAHVSALHNVDRMQDQMGAQILVEAAETIIGGEKGAAAGKAGEVASTMVLLKYSRDDEYEADKYGMHFMADAGYNPYGMVELLETLNKLGGEGGGKFSEMFQTHPLSSERVKRAQELIADTEEYSRFSPDQPDPNRQRFLTMRDLLIRSVPGLR